MSLHMIPGISSFETGLRPASGWTGQFLMVRSGRKSTSRTMRPLFHHQHDLADVIRIVDAGVRSRGVLEPEGRVDHWLELTLGDKRPHALLDGATYARLGLGALGAQCGASECQPPHHQAHQVDVDLGAFEEGNLDDAAVDRRSAQIALYIVSADHVEDHVGTMALGH